MIKYKKYIKNYKISYKIIYNIFFCRIIHDLKRFFLIKKTHWILNWRIIHETSGYDENRIIHECCYYGHTYHLDAHAHNPDSLPRDHVAFFYKAPYIVLAR
jgi:hypothetical protein